MLSEGSKDILGNLSNDSIAWIQINGRGNAGVGFPNAPDEKRVYFHVCNSNEKVVLGLGQIRDSSVLSSGQGDPDYVWTNRKYYYKIFDPSGTLVKIDSFQNNAKTPNVTSFDVLNQGPNINGIGTGYDTTGWVFNPLTTGDYYIEFMDDLSDVSSSNLPRFVYITYLDIVVYNESPNVELPGRLFSKNWVLRTDKEGIPFIYSSYEALFQRPFMGKVYCLEPSNNFVSSVDFRLSGMRALGFVLAFNNSGFGTSGNTQEDRRSQNGIPYDSIQGNYKVFFNLPDQNCYAPSANLPSIISGPKIKFVGDCRDSTNLEIRFIVQGSGVLEFFADFHLEDSIYTPNTEDLLFSQNVNLPVGSYDTIVFPWNGQNGLGFQMNFDQLDTTDLYGLFSAGVTHFMMQDVEYCPNGFEVRTEIPALFIPTLKWNDTLIPDLPGTSMPKFQEAGTQGVSGGRTREWTNFAYGDSNVINTWWEISTDTSYGIQNNLQPGNLAPDIYQTNDTLLTPNDTAVIEIQFNQLGQLCLNVTDPNDDTVFFYKDRLKNVSNGTFVFNNVNNDSCGLYTPDVNFRGYDTLIITACDDRPCELCDTLVAIFNVLGPQTDTIIKQGFIGDSATVCIDTTEIINAAFVNGCNGFSSGTAFFTNTAYSIAADGCVLLDYTNSVPATFDTLCFVNCDINNYCDTTVIITWIDTLPSNRHKYELKILQGIQL